LSFDLEQNSIRHLHNDEGFGTEASQRPTNYLPIMDSPNPIEQEMAEYERLVQSLCGSNPVEEARQKITDAAKEVNEWQAGQSGALNREQEELDRLLNDLRVMESDFTRLEARCKQMEPKADQAGEVDAYYDLVNQRTELARRLTVRSRELRERQAAANQRGQDFNEEAERRRAEFERIQANANARAEKHHRWLADRGPERLATDLNRLYAELWKKKRSSPIASPALEAFITRGRSLRARLGAHAAQQQASSEQGLLLTKAVLQGFDETEPQECVLCADNSATLSSLTDEMVDVLGIRDLIGDEIELTLPNQIRIKAPQLFIPLITVDGSKAAFVRAVVLKEATPGVDGSIGMSFLARFDFVIQRAKPQQLELRPRVEDPDAPSFNVFIGFADADAKHAQEVYEALKAAGYRPFFSKESLLTLHTTAYAAAIEQAIAEARHFVLVCSAPEHLKSEWVDWEWRMFDGLRRGGIKRKANLIPVLFGAMKPASLPMALTLAHSIVVNQDPNWKVTLQSFLPLH
jgi:hypothetical protein